jgi:predicted phosphodiesterase
VRYLTIADIHANLEALETVLAAAAGAWDRVLVLGDLVGYGGSPNEVVDRIRALQPTAIIRGNHDKTACGLEDGSNFNHVARVAATWTYDTLTPDNRQYLRDLLAGPRSIDDVVAICHGAPFDEDHYIFDADDALRALEASERPVCLFGHTHLPVIFHVTNAILDQCRISRPAARRRRARRLRHLRHGNDVDHAQARVLPRRRCAAQDPGRGSPGKPRQSARGGKVTGRSKAQGLRAQGSGLRAQARAY